MYRLINYFNKYIYIYIIIKNINGKTFVKEKLIENNYGKINRKNIYKIDKNSNKILRLQWIFEKKKS